MHDLSYLTHHHHQQQNLTTKLQKRRMFIIESWIYVFKILYLNFNTYLVKRVLTNEQ